MSAGNTPDRGALSVELRNEKAGFYRSLLIFILVLNLLGTGFFLYHLEQPVPVFSYGIFCLSLSVSAIVFRERVAAWRNGMGTTGIMLLLALWWLLTGYLVAALVLVLLGFLYRAITRPLVLVFAEPGIRYPSVPSRQIAWSELHNCVLKDGLLTIDFRNNRIIQQLVTDETSPEKEPEINEFCSSRIRTA